MPAPSNDVLNGAALRWKNFSTGYHSRNGGGDLIITDVMPWQLSLLARCDQLH
jgi:hypothetical protein